VFLPLTYCVLWQSKA